MAVRSALKTFLTVVSLLVCAALIYVFVVFFSPAQEEAQTAQPQLTASPAMELLEEKQLPSFLSAFPAPVLCAGLDNALELLGGSSRDMTYEQDGVSRLGRVLQLRYRQKSTGKEMDVFSIYPADALELLGREDYHMTADLSFRLSGWTAVRMESGTSVRLHIQTERGLYAVIVQKDAADALLDMTHALQLTTVTYASP